MLERLGFWPAYDIETDPEYPPAGDWGAPEYVFGLRPGPDTFAAATRTIRVRPSGSDTWVGHFPVETGSIGLYGCPSENQLLAVTGRADNLIDVRNPGSPTRIPIAPLRIVLRPDDSELVLLGTWTNLAAIDHDGLRWITGRLFLDDLEIVEVAHGQIVVRGPVVAAPGDSRMLTIDIESGDLIAGSPYRDAAYSGGNQGWRREDT